MTSPRRCITGANSFIAQNLESDIRLTRNDCDLLDLKMTNSVLTKLNPSSIINCAAKHGSIKKMSHGHSSYFQENIQIATNLLSISNELGINNVLLLGSISSFPQSKSQVITEKDYLGIPNMFNYGYNASKRYLVDLVKCYQLDFGRNFKVAHLGNVYGPHMKFGDEATLVANLIHKIDMAIQQKLNVRLYGDGEDVRSLTYVGDLETLLPSYLDYEDFKDALIISSGFEISIRELAHLIATEMGFKGRIIFSGEVSEVPRKVAKSLFIRELFPSFHFTEIESGLKKTIQWYGANYAGRPSSDGRASLS